MKTHTSKKSVLELIELVSRVQCTVLGHSFQFHVRLYRDIPYLQLSFFAPDNDRPQHIEEQWCRKWVLQTDMTESEVIRTCHKAVQAAVLHEADESFTYLGHRIYNPHHDVRELMKLQKVDKR